MIVACIVIVCLIVFVLPPSVQNILKTRNAVFNPLAYVTASFVHGSDLHLAGNLLLFIPSIFLLNYISKKANKQRFFLFSLPFIFLLVPILTYSIMNYYGIYRQVPYSFGLSLVDSALLGFFVPVFILYLRKTLGKLGIIAFFLSTIFLTFALIGAVLQLLTATVVSIVLGCGFAFLVSKKIILLLKELFSNKKNFSEVFVLLFSPFFYFFSIYGLFPIADQVVQGSRVGIVQHFIGLFIGIFLFSAYAISLVFLEKNHLTLSEK